MSSEHECYRILQATRKRLRQNLPNGYRFDDDIARGLSLPLSSPSESLITYLERAIMRLCLRYRSDFPDCMAEGAAQKEGCPLYYLNFDEDKKKVLSKPPPSMPEAIKKLVRKLRKVRTTIRLRFEEF